uniref:Uncharacterized protein n=1 Tax=Noctiluca scintillans TaxID=2966 RepID=A0A7S1FDY8_NOCSC
MCDRALDICPFSRSIPRGTHENTTDRKDERVFSPDRVRHTCGQAPGIGLIKFLPLRANKLLFQRLQERTTQVEQQSQAQVEAAVPLFLNVTSFTLKNGRTE